MDSNPDVIASMKSLARQIAPDLPESNFRVEPIESMAPLDPPADVVLSSAVLHFSRDEEQFWAMVHAMCNALAEGGLFFCRLASTIGMAERCRHVEGRRFVSPDGVERFLVDEAFLMHVTGELGGTLVDPLKTTVVQDQRCMTTWVVRK